MSIDIVGLGEPLLEFAASDGAAEYSRGFGGDTSNAIIAAARQGANTGYITKVSEDAFGDLFLSLWKDEGVDVSHVRQSAQENLGIYFVTPKPDGHQFSYYRKDSAASRITPEDLPKCYIQRAKILHVSAISQAISDSACDAVFAAMAMARDANVLVSYDTNLRLKLWPLPRARAVIHGAMAQCDIAFPSIEEAQRLTDYREPMDIITFYRSLGARIVALKMGKEGALVADERGVHTIAGLSTSAVDATGAGDTFAGAFLAQYLRSNNAAEAGRYANAAAALSTQGIGAVRPIPTREAVEIFLARTR